jgi:hypothetical protein
MSDEPDFADIDWAAAASMTQQVGATKTAISDSYYNGGNDAVFNQNNSNPNLNNNSGVHHWQQQHQQQQLPQHQTGDIESLRAQIQQLQSQLQSKDETISDLQNTAALSQYESTHCIKQAKEDAEKRIHLAEEKLRRVKMEADKYKNSLIRTKKRVTELENSTSATTSGKGTNHNNNNHHAGNTNGNIMDNSHRNLSAFGFPTDIETRRVTPNNNTGKDEKNNTMNDHYSTGQQLFENDNKKEAAVVSGSKRKMTDLSLSNIYNPMSTSLASQTLFEYDSLRKQDTIMQRLARHLIMRDEMGCYSLTQTETHLLLDLASDGVKSNNIGGIQKHQHLSRGEETRSYVRSILYQVIGIDGIENDSTHRSLSPSGLCYTLLTKMNSLFTNDHDQDHDHIMQQADTISCGTVVSSISVLHILRGLSDILALSTKARDDLRFWLYQSQQPLGRDSVQKNNTESLGAVHSRIEGLPSNLIKPASNDDKEAFWTSTCRATLADRGNEWDAVTMSQPCNLFFEILVALMKGRPYKSIPFDMESKGSIMVQLIRYQAICLVLTLMSDAPPYRHTESVGRTPYLWKFWFDSLFPSDCGHDETGTDEQADDFFSFWEVVEDGRGSSGRKRCVLKVTEETKKGKQRRSINNNGVPSNCVFTKQQETLSVKIKSGIIELLTHLVISSSSVHQSMYQSSTLARRVLAAILDDINGSILPALSPPLSKDRAQMVLQYLQLSYCSNQFILALSRSSEGIHILRYQMMVESDSKEGQTTNWSQSAIACMALVLSSVLSCANSLEEEEFTPTWAADLTPYLNRIAEQCVTFFKTIQSFSQNQKRSSSKSKPLSFSSMISEQHHVLLSCFQKLISCERRANVANGEAFLLWISDELKYDVQVMLEEALSDDV